MLVLLILARFEDVDSDTRVEAGSDWIHDICDKDANGPAGTKPTGSFGELDGETGGDGRSGQVIAEVEEADDATR